jgi:hypothetical protein
MLPRTGGFEGMLSKCGVDKRMAFRRIVGISREAASCPQGKTIA